MARAKAAVGRKAPIGVTVISRERYMGSGVLVLARHDVDRAMRLGLPVLWCQGNGEYAIDKWAYAAVSKLSFDKMPAHSAPPLASHHDAMRSAFDLGGSDGAVAFARNILEAAKGTP